MTSPAALVGRSGVLQCVVLPDAHAKMSATPPIAEYRVVMVRRPGLGRGGDTQRVVEARKRLVQFPRAMGRRHESGLER